jgi:hypothetical protein
MTRNRAMLCRREMEREVKINYTTCKPEGEEARQTFSAVLPKPRKVGATKSPTSSGREFWKAGPEWQS